MTTYKLQLNPRGEVSSVLKSDGWSIPFCEDNTDYQEYLKWLDAGNTPLLEEGNAPIPADDNN